MRVDELNSRVASYLQMCPYAGMDLGGDVGIKVSVWVSIIEKERQKRAWCNFFIENWLKKTMSDSGVGLTNANGRRWDIARPFFMLYSHEVLHCFSTRTLILMSCIKIAATSCIFPNWMFVIVIILWQAGACNGHGGVIWGRQSLGVVAWRPGNALQNSFPWMNSPPTIKIYTTKLRPLTSLTQSTLSLVSNVSH